MSKRPILPVLLIAALGIFFAAALSKAWSPLAEWDAVYLDAAGRLASGTLHSWVLDHPPLSALYMSLPFHLFGASPQLGRILNMLPAALAALPVFLAASAMGGRAAGAAAAVLYLINPVTIRGVQSLDSSDASLLPLGFAVFFWMLVRGSFSGRRGGALMAVVFCAMLWGKVTAAIGLAACAALGSLAGESLGREPRRILGWGVVGGGTLFFLSWSALSLPLWGYGSWLTVLTAPASALSAKASPAQLGRGLTLMMDAARLGTWFTPYLLLPAFYGMWRARKGGPAVKTAAFLCAAYFAAFLMVGGTNYGFPRYHAPISPALHVFAGCAAAAVLGELRACRYAAAAAFLCAFAAFAAFDPLLLLNLKVKQLVAAGDWAGLRSAALPLTVCLLAPLPALALLRRRAHSAALVCLCLAALPAACLASAWRQSRAAYAVAYQYGASGKEDVCSSVGAAAFGERVLATPEFSACLPGASVTPWRVWASSSALADYVSRERPEFIIAGWTTNTGPQLELLGALAAGAYSRREIGTYTVWTRERGAAQGD